MQGATSVALYGLGNIRDERLNRMFQVFWSIFFLMFTFELWVQPQTWYYIIHVSDPPCCTMDKTWKPRRIATVRLVQHPCASSEQVWCVYCIVCERRVNLINELNNEGRRLIYVEISCNNGLNLNLSILLITKFTS